MDNQFAAQLLLSHQLVSREQLLQLWPRITPEKDIGAVLLEHGLLAEETYAGLLAYLETRAGKAHPVPKASQAATSEPVHGRVAGRPAPTAAAHPAAERIPEPAEATLARERLAAARDLPMAGGIETSALRPSGPTLSEPPAPVKAPPPAASTVTLDQSWTPTPDAPPAPPATPGPEVAPHDVSPASSWSDLLAFARQMGASDLHLSAGNPILVRHNGSLRAVAKEPLAPETLRKWVDSALDTAQRAEFDGKGDLEIVYELPRWGRYRTTFLRQRRGCDITVRLVPSRIRSFEETGLPESCRDLTQWAQGMVLVTGPVGSGKSSTLAALVDRVNQERHDHIITLEDPIEIVYPAGRCRITQRHIGRHTKSQDAALRAALREDPDIIVIAELRDLDTIRLAVSAAETGHLVFGTMNTANAARTLFRLVDSFPPEEQGVVRNMISESLRGVISQQLLPLADGSGMAPAFEVLLVTSAVANMIRKEETHQLGTAMLTGKAQGMVLLDDSLKALVEKGLVDPREAQARAASPKDFDRYLRAGGSAAGSATPGAR